MIYVLELQNKKYYVGKTTQFEKTISKVFRGKGSVWSKMFPPVKVIRTETIVLDNEDAIDIILNKITIETMMEFGWQNVRGGFFTNSNEILHEKSLIHSKVLTIDGVHFPKSNADKQEYVYCLELEGSRFYVGISNNPLRRFLNHTGPWNNGSKSKGALYTKAYKPIKILATKKLASMSNLKYLRKEMQATINLMALVGCYKVRGGDFLHVDDLTEYKLFKNTFKKNKNSYLFPSEWLGYTFEDFMTDKEFSINSIDSIFDNL